MTRSTDPPGGVTQLERRTEDGPDGLPRLTTEDFQRLSSFLYAEVGHHLPPSKKTMLETRLRKRLAALGYRRYRDYVDFILSMAGRDSELVPLFDLVTTNKTDFFREPHHFDFMNATILPAFTEKRPFLTWSAGCSSGDEPYTVAMVLAEHAAATPGFSFRILATDISTRVLATAKAGIYSDDKVDPVPKAMARKYLMRGKGELAGKVRIVPELREKIAFHRLNFMDPDFGIDARFDIAFCRNVIIYFDKKTQRDVLSRIVRHIIPGGHLFIGHSESIYGMDLPLVNVGPTVFRKVN